MTVVRDDEGARQRMGPGVLRRGTWPRGSNADEPLSSRCSQNRFVHPQATKCTHRRRRRRQRPLARFSYCLSLYFYNYLISVCLLDCPLSLSPLFKFPLQSQPELYRRLHSTTNYTFPIFVLRKQSKMSGVAWHYVLKFIITGQYSRHPY